MFSCLRFSCLFVIISIFDFRVEDTKKTKYARRHNDILTGEGTNISLLKISCRREVRDAHIDDIELCVFLYILYKAAILDEGLFCVTGRVGSRRCFPAIFEFSDISVTIGRSHLADDIFNALQVCTCLYYGYNAMITLITCL